MTPIMTPEERQQALQGLLASRAWLEIIEPMLKAKISVELQALVDTGDDVHRGAFESIKYALGMASPPPSSARRRGRIKALQTFLTWPRQEVEQYTLDVGRKKAHNEEHERLVHYATWGRYSPVSPPDYPGSEGDR